MKIKKNVNGFDFLQNNLVPLMFIIICAICIPLSDFSPSYLLNEIVTRMGRNIFLILSLLIPIMAGMGLNFGMTLGAMAGQVALIFVTDWQIWGIPGVVLAMILSVPFSVLLGLLCGKLMNMAKGREMILGYMMNYFVTGLYQLLVLYFMGSIIPIKHASIMLPRGYGIRNTVGLLNMRQCLDNEFAILYKGVKIPVLNFIIIALLCLFIVWFRRTKLGQDMRAVGQDMEVAQAAGINVDRTRIISIIISTVFACRIWATCPPTPVMPRSACSASPRCWLAAPAWREPPSAMCSWGSSCSTPCSSWRPGRVSPSPAMP